MTNPLLKGLTDEQIEKLKNCKNHAEMLQLAKEEGVELTDEQLEAVSGGACPDVICPVCDAPIFEYTSDEDYQYYTCWNCDYKWTKRQ